MNSAELSSIHVNSELVQKGSLKMTEAGDQVGQPSNLCVKANRRGDILLGSELRCSLFSFDGVLISSLEGVQEKDGKLGPVSSVLFDDIDDDLAVIASDNVILVYDLRVSTKPVFSLRENSDEINQLRIFHEHLASCDDSGEVKVFDFPARKLFRTLRKKHKNICSSICFRKSASNELLSGSLDCQLILWNYGKIKVLDTINTQDLFNRVDGEGSAYMFNPPMINAIECSNDSEVLACGTGNGCIVLYDIAKGKKLKPYDVLRNHSSLGVSCLNLFEHGNQKYLVSGGNDCKLSVEKLQAKRLDETGLSSSTESFISMTSKINDVHSFAKSNKIFHLVCDQSSHLKIFEQMDLKLC